MERIQFLWQQYIDRVATDEEVDELFSLVSDPSNAEEHTRFLELLAARTLAMTDYDAAKWQHLAEVGKGSLHHDLESDDRTVSSELSFSNKKQGKLRNLRFSWLRYGVAIVLLITVVTVLYRGREKGNSDTTVATKNSTFNDVEPGVSGAFLTLDDGSIIQLDSLGNGIIGEQNGTQISLDNGQVQYDASRAKKVSYNTIATPKGRHFQLLLPDGSRVWLNAASSIRYPTVFKGNQRKVEVTGETYFEVATDAKIPFKVAINPNTEVEVLGTHFNVNGYEDETTIKTTLVDGSVRLTSFSKVQILTPGQQVQMQKSGDFKLIKQANIDQAIAWKNGTFNFQDMKLEEVMRQIARWYDVEIVYEKKIPEIELFGEMGRDLKLSQVLSGLKGLGVNFRLENGNRILVMP